MTLNTTDTKSRKPWIVHPRGDRVFIKRAPEEDTWGGILIKPDIAKQDMAQEGTVIAVGPGRTLEDGTFKSVDLREGDRVIVGKYTGHILEIDGEKYTVCREDEVVAVLTHPDAG